MLFARLEGRELSYNAYAYREDRKSKCGSHSNRRKRAREVESSVLCSTALVEVDVSSVDASTDLPGGKDEEEDGDSTGDRCILYRSGAFAVDIAEPGSGTACPAIMIELVGNRFLRRMVRILVVTEVCFFVLF